MAYYIRPMRKDDIPQVKIIDREAFPTMLPPPNFERELKNQMTHFYVVCDDSKSVEQEPSSAATATPSTNPGFLYHVKKWLGIKTDSDSAAENRLGTCYVCGYVGFWVMADEAHITTIAVKQKHQRKGIGELLLMAVFDRAREYDASVLTLEVRVSNSGAQKLYQKYGFREVGTRKGYYTDNREDAFIMTTDEITTAEYTEFLQQLFIAHTERWGSASFTFSEE